VKYFIKVSTNDFTEPTKISVDYSTLNIVTYGMQKYYNLLFNTHVNSVMQ
jgi:hypothetical protein